MSGCPADAALDRMLARRYRHPDRFPPDEWHADATDRATLNRHLHTLTAAATFWADQIDTLTPRPMETTP